MWLKFLSQGRAVMRPFIDFKANTVSAEVLSFFSDASRAKNFSFGAIFNQSWTFSMWEEGYIEKFDPSIEHLELYALAIGEYLWSHHLRNLRIIIFFDNLSVSHVVNKANSSCHDCQLLLRVITSSLEKNVRFFCRHVTLADNLLADLLSRN